MVSAIGAKQSREQSERRASLRRHTFEQNLGDERMGSVAI